MIKCLKVVNLLIKETAEGQVHTIKVEVIMEVKNSNC